MSQRVLITGGTGFVGSRLSARLGATHPDWTVMPLGGPSGRSENSLNVEDATAVFEALRRFRPTIVVHMAGITSVMDAARDPRRAWAVNFGGAYNLVEALVSELPSCRLLAVSSAEVYGRSLFEPGPRNESARLQPTNDYATSKAAADLFLKQHAFAGLDIAIVRPFNHTGPGQTEAFVVPSFAAQIARIEAGLHEPTIRVGSLDDERDFLDVEDVVDAYVALLERWPGPSPLVLNLASGSSVRIGDLLDHLLSATRVKIKVHVDPARLRAGGISKVTGDATLANRLLAWLPKKNIFETCAQILDFERAQIQGYR